MLPEWLPMLREQLLMLPLQLLKLPVQLLFSLLAQQSTPQQSWARQSRALRLKQTPQMASLDCSLKETKLM